MIKVLLHWEFTTSNSPDAELVDATEAVMDELLKLEDECLMDSSVSLDLHSRTVEIEIVATGEDYVDASERALSCVRTAIHASGGSTPDWPEFLHPTSHNAAELIDAS